MSLLTELSSGGPERCYKHSAPLELVLPTVNHGAVRKVIDGSAHA